MRWLWSAVIIVSCASRTIDGDRGKVEGFDEDAGASGATGSSGGQAGSATLVGGSDGGSVVGTGGVGASGGRGPSRGGASGAPPAGGGAAGASFTCDSLDTAPTRVVTLDPKLYSQGDDPSVDAECRIVNPERGFFRFMDLRNLGSLDGLRSEGYSLVYGKVLLDDYRDRDLDSAILGQLASAFAALRSAGVKVVPRFYYADDGTSPDAPLERVLGHIAQLKPLLQESPDVIAALYAGFVGAWGEWHASTNGLTDPAPRKAILDALLDAMSPRRSVLVRRPSFKEEAYGGPLDSASAYRDIVASRIGHHNDCFVSSDDDVGTYQLPGERDYLLADSAFTAVGGETCAVFPARSACAPAMAEMAAVHLSFLNSDYHPDVIGSWRDGGCFDQISCRMGYRFGLLRYETPESVARGEVLAVKLELVNDGYARPYASRPVEFVLAGPELRRLETLVDARSWTPGAPLDVCLAIPIPADIVPAGTYQLGLAFPDEQPGVRGDPRFSIRLASGATWDAAIGANMLDATVVVHD